MKVPFQVGQNLLFVGDSITDCGRERPVGNRNGNLGNGYVYLVDCLLGAALSQAPVNVLNTGISGDCVTDLQARWQSDVLDLDPNWLSIMIGINDVWYKFESEPGKQEVDPNVFERVYRELIEKTRPRLSGLILMSPFFLETDQSEPMRAQMNLYGQITHKLANDYDAVFVDVQAAFDRHLAHQPAQSLSADRVHPNGVGHAIIAQALLSELSKY
jgi:lysophospholipase L1-like esterase